MRKLVAVLAMLWQGACGDDMQVVTTGPSCAGVFSERNCADFVGATPAQVSSLETLCKSQLKGTFSSRACDRSGAVGGCLGVTSNIQAVTWFYADSGLSAGDLREACAKQSQAFVAP
jgi:hypothetical protein